MRINTLSFNGIRPRYTNSKNYTVIPISKDPSIAEIEEAKHAAETKTPHCGLNGSAYFYGKDLVVKKYLSADKACNYGPDREISALDLMYENSIKGDNIQEGIFAFKDPDNQTYLVSGRITGKKPDSIQNPYNEKNLKKLIQKIALLDTPILCEKNRTTSLFPFQIPMHYDLCSNNVTIEKDNAGIIDFEYLELSDCSELYQEMNTNGTSETFSDISDIPGIVSNLRTFEYRSLLSYILKLPQEQRKDFFTQYLKIKSDYHIEMLKIYFDLSYNNSIQINDEQRMELLSITNKHISHSELLKNPSKEIIKAEAMKIQICSFIYAQSPFSMSKSNKININQIIRYLHNANKFFEEMYNNSETKSQALYWDDCRKLGAMFNNVINWMAHQARYTESDINKHELFMQKLTDKTITTLDEAVA